MLFFSEANQILDLNGFTIVRNRFSIVSPKHLVDFTKNDPQVGPGKSFLERRKDQIQAAIWIAELPRFHIISRVVFEPDLSQLVDMVVQDQCILTCPRQVTKAASQVKANLAAVA